MNHYPRHIGDWMVATAHLTEVEECMYSRMVDAYYAREGPLPLDVAAVCRLVRASSSVARKAANTVLREFFKEEADGWHQKRCDQELAAYREKAAKASESAHTRWDKRNANAMRTHMPTHSEGNANHKPEPITKRKANTTPGPHCVRPEVWQRWLAYKGKQKPDTVGLQAQRLTDWSAQGHDANEIVLASIANNWAGLFPPKSQAPPSAKPSLAEQRKRNMDEICGVRNVVNGVAERVGTAVVQSIPRLVREQGSDGLG